jgi:hypothetical protein
MEWLNDGDEETNEMAQQSLSSLFHFVVMENEVLTVRNAVSYS